MNSVSANPLQVSLISVTYAGNMRFLALCAVLALTACNTSIYTMDGVTDGDTFYLAPRAYGDDDPVLQSWVAYSLMRGACQLELGGDNPARNSGYGCEFTARQHLLNAWEAQRTEHPGASDPYLDSLLLVREAGFLDEYVVHYFGADHWQIPVEVRVGDFGAWQRKHLRRHRHQTQVIGSWNYREL